MARSVTVRPFRRLTQAELDSFLEKAANICSADWSCASNKEAHNKADQVDEDQPR
jgi:hypothetical protein